MGFGAVARSVALLRCSEDSADSREIEYRRQFASRLAGLIPEPGIHWRRVCDLTRIKQFFRIPAMFNRPNEGVVCSTAHERQELALKPAISGFTPQRTVLTFHQLGYVSRNDSKQASIIR